MPHSPQKFYEKMAIKKDNLHNRKLGLKGEKKARRYLVFHGWKILEKNYKTPFGEIDIVARKRDVLAFIEVKTRLTDKYGSPSEAVTETRKRRYISGANYYLCNKDVDMTVRFDIIEIYRDRLNHIENAFYSVHEF